LSAFAARPDVNDLKWPSGFTWHSSEQLEQRMMKWANRGPIARHWWNEFWASDSVEGALAAWHLFLASADRRAHSWMQTDADSYPGDSALNMLKAVHWRLNRTSVSRAMDRQENGSYRLDERFVGAEAPSPWLSLDEQCFIQAGLGEVSVAK
jgi:hypothetical protein